MYNPNPPGLTRPAERSGPYERVMGIAPFPAAGHMGPAACYCADSSPKGGEPRPSKRVSPFLDNLIPKPVKKLEKLFIAPKVRQVLYETSQRVFTRCACAQRTGFLIKFFNQESVSVGCADSSPKGGAKAVEELRYSAMEGGGRYEKKHSGRLSVDKQEHLRPAAGGVRLWEGHLTILRASM